MNHKNRKLRSTS